jgi:hypothetical protein
VTWAAAGRGKTASGPADIHKHLKKNDLHKIKTDNSHLYALAAL